MNKKLIKTMAGIMAAAMLLGGCSSEKKIGSSSKVITGKGELITEEPTEISVLIQSSGEQKYEEKDTWKEAARLTNVTAKQSTAKNVSTIQEAFSLMMSTGELSDLVYYIDRTDINKYGQEGAFAPLNDLIDEYAPNYKKYLDEHPEVKKAITTDDGQIYGLMVAGPDDVKAAQGWEIRKDWLDKLGLEIPKTVDELHDVLKAFIDNDANGNGKKDEIPFFSRLSSNESFEPLIALWGARKGLYLGEDKKIHFGPAEKEYQNAYSNVAKWYSEGIIDKEIFSRGGKARNELFGQDVGGCTHDWFFSTCQFNDLMKSKNPDFKLVTFLPPAGKEVKVRDSINTGLVAAISAQSDKKEIALRWFDFWFGETGSRLINYGFEGKQYDMVDGVPTFKESMFEGDSTVLSQLYSLGAQQGPLFAQDFNYEKQCLNDEGLKGIEDYEASGLLAVDEEMPILNFSAEEQKELASLMTDINTYVSEHTQKWILGVEDCNTAFDGYLNGLKDMGLDRMLEIQQAAYERYLKK